MKIMCYLCICSKLPYEMFQMLVAIKMLQNHWTTWEMPNWLFGEIVVEDKGFEAMK